MNASLRYEFEFCILKWKIKFLDAVRVLNVSIKSCPFIVLDRPLVLQKSVPPVQTVGTRRCHVCQPYAVLISVIRRVDPRAVVRPEELNQSKIPRTPSGIESATFRLVAQCSNNCATAIDID
jgi:hypothetical protein